MRSLLAALLVVPGLLASAGGQTGPDHLKCYKVKDPQAKKTYSADLGGLVAEPGCTIKVPAVMACVPATKTNVTPTPPGVGGSGIPNAFGCYKIKCPKTTLPPFALNDQFGSRSVTPSVPKLLCAPVASPTTTSVTTSTTTTTTNPPCVAGACEACGSCGHGECHKSGGGAGCGAPGTSPICADKTTCVTMSCSSDADCHDASRPICIFGGVTGSAGCCALCP